MSSSGKTLLNQANIGRDADEITKVQDGSLHTQIVCVWQEGADALLEQYKDLTATLPKSNNLEVLVLTKKELMKKFRIVERDIESTSNQINSICFNIPQILKNRTVHLYIDECWVTVPRKFSAHLTAVSSLYVC